MARYRKIDTRMWGDSRFRELSSPVPSGKYLWVFLLTGPHTSNIPGFFHAGEMALAEELEWSIEGFRKVFAEALAKGLVKADWKARVVWVPNAIKYNQPESPNVVRSWRTAWDEIPECTLKVGAHKRLKAFTEDLGEAFAKAFAEACAKPLPNQEQEQEQEPKQDQEKEEGAVAPPPNVASVREFTKAPKGTTATLELPDWMPLENWQGFVDMRQRMKAALTPRAVTLAIRQLDKLRMQGADLAAVLDQSVVNGWKGIFPLKQEGPRNENHNGKGNRAERRQASNLAALATAKAQDGLDHGAGNRLS